MANDYWMLECYFFDEDDYTDVGKYPAIDGVTTWADGRRFDKEIPQPLKFEWEPSSSGPKLAYYKNTIPLLRKDVFEALRAAGVDNLDAYRAEIRDAGTGQADTTYVAVNVIGLVSAADLAKSDHADPSGGRLIDMDFESLAIDPSKAKGMKMFRLAECVTGVLIHKSVKEHLESKGGFGLTFVPPSEWIG